MAPLTFSTGQRIQCNVESLAFGGAGVARVGGLVFFIENALPGERVSVEIVRVSKRFVRARMAALIEAAPERVTPPCKLYGRCGGCQLQHMAYAAQVEWKTRQVRDVLERIGFLSGVAIGDVIPSPGPYGYRNAIRLHLASRNPPRYGYYSIDNQKIIPVARCDIAESPINTILPDIGRHIRGKRTADQVMIHADADAHVTISPHAGRAPVITERLCGTAFTLSASSFFQVNRSVAARLVDLLKGIVTAAGSAGTLFDFYCGAGIFSILLEPYFSLVVGVDSDPQAIAHAGVNRARADRGKFSFTCGRVEQMCADLYNKYAREGSVILLDPPRGGLGPGVLKFLASLDRSTARIIYVSCNPGTLARDLHTLCGSGVWRVDNVAVLDMFPQTAHIEVCCAIVRDG